MSVPRKASRRVEVENGISRLLGEATKEVESASFCLRSVDDALLEESSEELRGRGEDTTTFTRRKERKRNWFCKRELPKLVKKEWYENYST